MIREWNKARGKLEKSCWVGNTAEGKRMRNGLVGAKIQRNQSSQENSQGWSHETNGRDQRTWSKIGKFLVCNLVNCKFLPEQSSN